MKGLGFFLVVALGIGSLPASAATPCEELKAALAAKLDAKGVKDYALEIVATDQVADHKVIGSCDGGAKKIIYTRGGAVSP